MSKQEIVIEQFLPETMDWSTNNTVLIVAPMDIEKTQVAAKFITSWNKYISAKEGAVSIHMLCGATDDPVKRAFYEANGFRPEFMFPKDSVGESLANLRKTHDKCKRAEYDNKTKTHIHLLLVIETDVEAETLLKASDFLRMWV